MHRIRNGSTLSRWRGSECSEWGVEAVLEKPRSPKDGPCTCAVLRAFLKMLAAPQPLSPVFIPQRWFAVGLILFSFSAKGDLSELTLSEIRCVSMPNAACIYTKRVTVSLELDLDKSAAFYLVNSCVTRAPALGHSEGNNFRGRNYFFPFLVAAGGSIRASGCLWPPYLSPREMSTFCSCAPTFHT